jgi:hypothetical protein
MTIEIAAANPRIRHRSRNILRSSGGISIWVGRRLFGVASFVEGCQLSVVSCY